jgi:dienelactone hydrolase
VSALAAACSLTLIGLIALRGSEPLAAAPNAASAAPPPSPTTAPAGVGAAGVGAAEKGVTLLRSALVIKLSEDLQARNGLGLDPIEARLVRGSWTPPAAGTSVRFADGAVRGWREVRADPRGWFELDTLEGGYALFRVDCDREKVALLEAMGDDMVFVNGVPRAGSQYALEDPDEAEAKPWEPRLDFSVLPIPLRKGRNELLFRCYRGRLKVNLRDARQDLFFNAKDTTLPDLVVAARTESRGAVVVVNAADAPLRGASISARLPGGPPVATPVPTMPPMSVRKVGFLLAGPAPDRPGDQEIVLELHRATRPRGPGALAPADSITLPLKCVDAAEPRKITFVSGIDGSVQYYALNPARVPADRGAGAASSSHGAHRALFLSLHGAAVEAINQARAYGSKTWGDIVAPTNRRPYGFNWEDWGRLDALEVLALAEKDLGADPARVYLTGHSMGGHGTWSLGGILPDRFAAIGPSAGWLSFWSYRARKAPSGETPIGRILLRAVSPTDTAALAVNLRGVGVYAIHGSADDNVPVTESRAMVERLSAFHRDFVYHEQPGAGHWWDLSDEPGADCVDWAPLFDFFATHVRPAAETVREVEFATASPGISAWRDWAGIEAQTKPLEISSVKIRCDPFLRRFAGTTSNVSRLALDLSPLIRGEDISLDLDGQTIDETPWPAGSTRIHLARTGGRWSVSREAPATDKGPMRYGPFKEAFRNRMQFVYGTKGTPEENAWALAKARYDAERFWYQGNGSIDIVPDVEFAPDEEPDRNVILYGNAKTNAAWRPLLRDSPVQVDRAGVRIGHRTLTGPDLACLFLRPRPRSAIATVGVVSGSGLIGMRLTTSKLYLEAGYPFPDCIVFRAPASDDRNRAGKAPHAKSGSDGIIAAGFFGIDWSVGSGDFAWGD